MIKLSIIVPVYCVERYVERCLQSLIHQNLHESEYEIIVVNDETKDTSWDIVKQVASQCTNMILLEQKNQGQGIARNNGLKHAKGKYVWFVDSDDWIEENCLNDIYLKLEHDTDILAFCNFFQEGNWEKKYIYVIPEEKQTICDWLEIDSPNPTHFYWFRREFLTVNHLEFFPNIKHEDSLFTPIAIASAQKIQFYPKPQYHFLKRPGSTTTTLSIDRVHDYEVVLEQSYSFMQTISDLKIRTAYRTRLANIFMAYLDASNKIGSSCYKEVSNWIKQHKEIYEILKYSNKRPTLYFYYINKILPLSTLSIYTYMARIRYK